MESRSWVTRANMYLKCSFPLKSSAPQLFFCSHFPPFKSWNNDIFSDFAYHLTEMIAVFYTFICISLVHVTDLVLEMGCNRNKHQKSWDPYLIFLACLICSLPYFWSLLHFFKLWLYFYLVLTLQKWKNIPHSVVPLQKVHSCAAACGEKETAKLELLQKFTK